MDLLKRIKYKIKYLVWRENIVFNFDRLKTIFISLFKSKLRNIKNSHSSNTDYPNLVLKAVINPSIYSIFRRHFQYTEILEHTSKIEASKYLRIIFNKYKLSADEIIKLIEPLQEIGSPKKFSLSGLSIPVSPGALRYLKIALDVKEQIKDKKLKTFLEIGCGYGGQAIILNRLIKFEKYIFIDLWQVNLLIRKFIEDCSFDKNYTLSTLGELNENYLDFDFVMSNYAFSEMPKKLQIQFFNKIISKSKNGYMIMNSGIEGKFCEIDNLSQKELLSMIKDSKIEEENPLTHLNNYLIKW